ncbi:RNA recognition motif domain-containing protein [Vibrio sp. V39_P1S14PM300]|uniref:RNA recognition motif domain-containing protein n=1 Tax=Vibrio sp. V39_P1S14PM300 TaxID=1938690 RepID=UPI001372DDCF|nr:RNA-binding protein [Vibrio sp. V39_P1S14PM300]NAX22643.1 RNA-binding protein [Vibrio sp. V39_P1S14PM300]
MNSNKSTLLIVALAVLGGIVFSQVSLSPALTFVIGVLSCAFVLKLLNTNTESVTDNTNPLTKTLYVGNLPYKANESHVRELFAKHGEVFAVRLMKDKRTGKRRGFGFVVMAAADAEGAIQDLNEQDYMQRTLKVRIANDPKHPESENAEQE